MLTPGDFTLLDALGTQICVVDDRLGVVFVNQAWKAFADAQGRGAPGYGVGDMYAVPSLNGGEARLDAAKLRTGLQDVLAGRRPDFVMEYDSRSGVDACWFRLRAMPITRGDRRCLLVEHTDMSDFALATEQLLEHTVQQRTLVSTCPDVCIILNGAGVIEFANRGLAEHGRDELLLRSLHDLFTAEQRPAIADALETSRRRNEVVTCKASLEARAGDTRHVVLRVRPYTRHDNSVGYVAFATDVTEAHAAELRLKEQERALEASRRQLLQSQKMESIGLLAGGIAHDFNNLLTVIIMFARTAIDRFTRDDPRREELAQILRAADRAEALTRQLLVFSRNQPAEASVLGVNGLVENLYRMLRRMIAEDIAIELDLDPSQPAILIDPGQFEQLIINLAVNARDAMPQGGTLRLQTRRSGQQVTVSVADTGVGMSPELIERIFEPFFTTKPKGKGTGLGLSTCFGIVRQAGGELRVASEPGKGSTFTAVFAAAQDERAREARTMDDAESSPSAPQLVLVAEDEPVIRQLVADKLRAARYRVEEIDPNAFDPLLVARAHLLLTDVVMPGKNGPTLARELCALNPELRVLFMTGYTDDNRFELQALDRHGLLRKPFDAARLVGAVRVALEAEPSVVPSYM